MNRSDTAEMVATPRRDAQPAKDLAKLATILADAKKRLGYTVDDICHKARIGRSTWYRIQSRTIAQPGIPTLTALAAALKLSADELHLLAGHRPVGPPPRHTAVKR